MKTTIKSKFFDCEFKFQHFGSGIAVTFGCVAAAPIHEKGWTAGAGPTISNYDLSASKFKRTPKPITSHIRYTSKTAAIVYFGNDEQEFEKICKHWVESARRRWS